MEKIYIYIYIVLQVFLFYINIPHYGVLVIVIIICVAKSSGPARCLVLSQPSVWCRRHIAMIFKTPHCVGKPDCISGVPRSGAHDAGMLNS